MHACSIILATTLLAMMTCACRKGEAPADNTVHLRPTKDDSAQTIAAAQDRIAGAFYATIVPKLKTCWDRVQGKGGIRFQYTYQRVGNNWVWQAQKVDASSLGKGQDAAAMQCMQDSARGSSFPLEPGEAARDAKELVIHWGWPVPLPADTTQLARMISEDPPPACLKLCQDCVPNNEGRSVCVSSCKGFTGCIEDGTGTGCRMSRPECATGWSGPSVGAAIAREQGVSPLLQGQ